MKRHFFCLITGIFMIVGFPVYGQIGHGTSDPSKASAVEMLSPTKGLLIPRVELSSLTVFAPIAGESSTNPTKVNSLLVYNTATAGTAPNNVTPGYYYWTTDGTTGKWNRLINDADIATLKAALPKYFYMPSIIIPTDASHIPTEYNSPTYMTFNDGTKIGSINLHAIYTAQFSGSMGSSSTKSSAAGTLPVILPNELNYYITWYDNTVFENVTVSNTGTLGYKVKDTASVDEGSFMNIVFEVRETPSSP